MNADLLEPWDKSRRGQVHNIFSLFKWDMNRKGFSKENRLNSKKAWIGKWVQELKKGVGWIEYPISFASTLLCNWVHSKIVMFTPLVVYKYAYNHVRAQIVNIRMIRG